MLDLDLQSGKILAIQGDMATVSTILISMAVKLQDRSHVLFIDSANTFNPSFLQEKYHKCPRISINRISIARPFSPDQLLALVKKLDGVISQTGAKSVIISSIDAVLYDQDENEKDVAFILAQIIETLSLLVRRKKIVLLMGISPRMDDPGSIIFKQAMSSYLDVLCHV